MNTDIDFKKIWSAQKMETPEIKEIYDASNRFKRKALFKLILVNTLLILTISFICFIWYYYQPEFITSKIGIVLTILAMVVYLIPYNRAIPLLIESSIELSSKIYLQQLIQLKEKQLFLQTKVLSAYFLLLSVGIGLYMFEYTLLMPMSWRVVAYGLTLLWIAFNWFYLRPMTIKKQNTKMDDILNDFRELDRQLSLQKDEITL